MDSDSDENEFQQQWRALEEGCRHRNYKERINFNPDLFEGTFRLTREGVHDILDMLNPFLQPETGRIRSLSSEEQFLVALRFYSTDGYYRLVGDAHSLSDSSVCRVVKKVTSAINVHLFREVVRWPERLEDRRDIAERFYKFARMPCISGCIDGTLIPIIRPSEYEEQFVDRKGQHSLNAMMVCGPEMQMRRRRMVESVRSV